MTMTGISFSMRMLESGRATLQAAAFLTELAPGPWKGMTALWRGVRALKWSAHLLVRPPLVVA